MNEDVSIALDNAEEILSEYGHFMEAAQIIEIMNKLNV